MTEGEPKFEKIIKGIEKIPAGEPEEKEEVLEFSPQEKAEQVWAFWSDYRKKKYETLLKEKKLAEKERKKQKEIEELPELVKLKEEIASRWRDKRVQILFKNNLEENLKEREKISPDLEDYQKKEIEEETTKRNYETILRDLFIHRGEEPDELTQIKLAELSVQSDVLKANLEKTFQENPELASHIEYERIKEFHRQFEKDGFIWSPSRQKLFEKILEHLVILNKNRPMLLTGETGTGKTRLVRAAVNRLTNRPPFEIGEEAKSDIRPILGSASIEKEKTYITYGPLGQALTGKKTSLEKESDGGGIFYMDEMNGYPPDALRSLIKQISGRKPGEKVTFAAWRGVWEEVAEKSGLIGAANLASEKHPDRPEMPVEIIRELTTVEVDYPEQSKENPELYEMMLAALMDKNGRIRLREGELEPAWQEKVEPKTKEKIKELNSDPKLGGTLWRFANLIAEIQRSYKGEPNALTPLKADASYLQKAVLDPGIVLAWLREYRISFLRKNAPLKKFLQEKLFDWSSQKTYPQEDCSLLKEFFAAFDLPVEGPEVGKSDIKGEKIWSEKEIGFLSPRVPRPKEKIEDPKPISKITFSQDGSEIEYQPTDTPEELVKEGKIIIFAGQTSEGKIVLEEKATRTAMIIEKEEFEEMRRGSYLEAIKKELKDLKLEELDRKIKQIIDNLAETMEPKKQKKYQQNLKKEVENMPAKKKIEFILEQLEKTFQ